MPNQKSNHALKTQYERVLLIDEDMIDNFINERMVLTSSFASQVIVKTSAMEALSYLGSLLKEQVEQLPQIIFLDLNMPAMDGFEFLEEFASMKVENNSLKICKIIVLSSSISPVDIDRASANQLVYKYINKPLTSKYLEAIII